MQEQVDRSAIREPTFDAIERAMRHGHQLRNEAIVAGAKWIMARLRKLLTRVTRPAPKSVRRAVRPAPIRGVGAARRRVLRTPKDEAA